MDMGRAPDNNNNNNNMDGYYRLPKLTISGPVRFIDRVTTL